MDEVYKVSSIEFWLQNAISIAESSAFQMQTASPQKVKEKNLCFHRQPKRNLELSFTTCISA